MHEPKPNETSSPEAGVRTEWMRVRVRSREMSTTPAPIPFRCSRSSLTTSFGAATVNGKIYALPNQYVAPIVVDECATVTDHQPSLGSSGST